MNVFYYIRYFFYILWNWNVRLASFSIYHELRGEKKYGLNTIRLDDPRRLTVTGRNLEFAQVYQGANYYLLEKIFSILKEIQVPDGFVDVGCGKGRVMIVAAHNGFKNITGIEFARELWLEATRNCNRASTTFPEISFKVVHNDAADYVFEANTNVFFFFNPFKEKVMTLVVSNILRSVRNHPRKIWIVYMNPQHKIVFTKAGFKEIFFIKRMQFVEAAIYEKGP